MKHNVVAPSVGESITEVSILKWHKQTGQAVKPGDLLMEIESDKATVEIVAEQSGVLTQVKPAGERIPIGEVVATIDDAAKARSRQLQHRAPLLRQIYSCAHSQHERSGVFLPGPGMTMLRSVPP